MEAVAFAFGESTRSEERHRTQSRPKFSLAQGISVLLAEDSQANRLIVAEILRRDGFNVDVVADGLEATDAAKSLPYDVILMDIDMPEMDGVEATHVIRRSECEGDHVPIIALTAHANAEDSERFISEGMDDYVSKPIDRLLLSNKILYWAGRATSQPEKAPESRASEIESPDSSYDLLDRDALSQLAEDTSPEVALKLIAVFIKELRARAEQIEDSGERGDMDGLASQAHALKSSAATYGAAIVRGQALCLDSACKKGAQSTAMAASRGLLEAVEPTAEALIAYTAEVDLPKTDSNIAER